MAIGITYLDGRRIRRGLRAGALRVMAAQEHLNKINVYPVPDGDTGTNLALTMSSVVSAMSAHKHKGAGDTLTHVADAALDGARGNSGAIVAQFFHGLSDSVADLTRVSVAEFAAAVRSGEHYARDALVRPVEGTVLTVMRDFAKCVERLVGDEPRADFRRVLREGLAGARQSLTETPDKLDALRAAGVVDAGAEGFVRLVDGICEFIDTGHVDASQSIQEADEAVSGAGEDFDLEFRYCTECVITGDDINRRALKESLMEMGGSLVLAGTHRKTRVHIHVNDPQAVFEQAAQHGAVSGTKADDMHRQSELHAATQETVIAMDSAGDIPDEALESLGVHMTPVRLHFGNESYLDKVSISADTFYQRLAEGGAAPKTSQPPPGDFRRDFQFLATHYPSVVCINVSGAASGTYQSAVSAAERSGTPERINVFDSWNVSVGQGLLALHAAEMARNNASADEILASLTDLRARTPIYALVRDLEAAVRGGRVSRTLKRIVDALKLTPVLGIRGEGRLTAVGMLLGRRRALEKYLRFVLKRVQPGVPYRLAVGHTNCEDEAREVYETLANSIPNLESHFFCRVGSALGAHTGGESVVVALQPRD